jgi:amino acid transporter/nucleotide-binding universal stress UspA family protein
MEKETPGNFVRELGLTEALNIGLGTMLGAGIFVLAAIAAERAGPASVFSYVAAGLLCLSVALVVSELATGIPRAGGSYTFITLALGPLAGSIVGPGNWLGLTFANGFYLLAFGEYLSLISPLPPWSGSLLAGILFTWLNYRGAKITGRVQNIVVVILVIILMLFVGIGVFNVETELYQPFAPRGFGAIIGVIGLIIVSFTGFEKISTMSGEMKRPERNLPLSIGGSVVIATLLYGLILFVLTGIIPYSEIGQERAPLVEAARRIAGPAGMVAMIGAAILATLSSANAAIMASSRISYGMGRDRVLPGWFSFIHPKLNTPTNAILVSGALGILLSLSGQAEVLAEISSTLFMVSYALLSLSLIIMRRSRPSWYQPSFRVPLYPILPVLAGCLSLAVTFTMAPESRAAGLILVGGNMVWYLIWVRRKATVNGEFGPFWDRERPLEGIIEAAQGVTRPDGHEILVPLLPETSNTSIMRLAAYLSRVDTLRVIVGLDVVVVPQQTPLDSVEMQLAQEKSPQQNSRLAKMAQQGAELGVPVRPLRRAARAVESGVLAVAEARPSVDLILLSWQGPLSAGRIYGSPSKEVLQKAQCDVAVLHDRSLSDDLQKILVPASGGPHARLGLQIAADITRSDEAELTLLRIVRPSEEIDTDAEELGLRRLAENVLGESGPSVRTRVVAHAAVVDGILEEARSGGYDLVIIGASNEWAVKSLLVGAVPDAIADRAPCSVLLVRRHEISSVSNIRRVLRSIKGW